MGLTDLRGRPWTSPLLGLLVLWSGLIPLDATALAAQQGPTFHGRIMLDFPGLDAPPDSLRSLRLKINGELPAEIEWKAQLEVGSFDFEFKELYLDREIGAPLRARAGYFREPMGLEGQTSLENLPFPERSAPTQAFTPGRNVGLMAHGGQAVHWALGGFGGSSDVLDKPNGERAISARLHGAPEEGNGFIHLGLSASYRDGNESGLRFSAQPGTHSSPRLIDTGVLPAARATTLGLEFAHARGPWTTVAEIMGASVHSPDQDRSFLSGAQVSAALSLDKQPPRWDSSRGRWGRANPTKDGVSAEFAAQIAFTNLDAGNIQGGAQFDWGCGLNLHFTPRSRLMLHYRSSRLAGQDEGLDMLLVRVQVGF